MRRIGCGQMGLRIKLTGGDGGLGGGVMRELIFGIKDGRVNSIKDREVERDQGWGGRVEPRTGRKGDEWVDMED